MAQRGAGAPPPRRSGGGGGNDKAVYHLSETCSGSNNEPRLQMVKSLKLRAGTKNQPILTLDDFQNMDDGYSINIHMFNLRGTKDNIVVCPKTAADPRPCPVCEVLNKDPSWFVALTAIDRNKYTFERVKDGKKSSVTYTDLRRIVLVTQTWLQRMTTNAERGKGWRGSLFEVSRSEPLVTEESGVKKTNWKDSPRIGDVWYFVEKYDEEKLKSEFEKRAADYGLPVERFVQPLNYDVLLKAKSHDQLLQIAADIRNDGSALKDPEDGAASVSSAVSSAVGAASDPEAEINY